LDVLFTNQSVYVDVGKGVVEIIGVIQGVIRGIIKIIEI
jgi:hypothetical protein